MSMMEHADEDRNTIGYIMSAIVTARAVILGMTLFTAINLAVLLFRGDTTIPFALSTPFYLTWMALFLENGVAGVLTYGAVGISLSILGAFLLCWLLSRKHPVWLTIALILTVVDTLLLVGFTFWMFENPSANMIEVLVEGMLIVLLFRGVSNARRLERLKKENH